MKTKTPPTIPAPLPTDHRLLRLAALLKVSRRDALGATVDAWAWIQTQATEGIVPQPVVLLDSIAEIEGYGEAAVAVGLVGTADGNIVAPAELRDAAAHAAARRAGTADDDARDQKRRQARDRQRRRRYGSRLTGKAKTPPTTPPPPLKVAAPAEATTPSRRSRRLGTVAPGQDVMLLWSTRNSEWFYKVTGATPPLTGTVTDQDNPTLADALKALMDARLTQAKRDGENQGVISPSMEDLVAAARRHQADRQAATAAAARVDVGNDALARAADDDADQDDHEPAGPATTTTDNEPEGVGERDCHALVTPVTRDTVTCHASVTRDIDTKTLPGNGLDAVFCHASVTPGAPSSSSISSLNEFNESKDTTTTSGTADHERDDHADQQDDFDRYLKTSSPAASSPADDQRPLDPAVAARLQRLAAALETTTAAVVEQARYSPAVLAARLKAKGIDSRTGWPIAACAALAGEDARTSPQVDPGRQGDIGTGVHAVTDVQAAGGIVDARSGDEFDCPAWKLRDAMQRQGIPTPAVNKPPEDDADQDNDEQEQQRRHDALLAIAACR